MLKAIKASTVEKLLPKRDPNSHKGQNGRVLIVGGCLDYYGAPILAGLGALYSGADLVHLYVPECNFECTRSMYPDFIVHKYQGDFLQARHTDKIIELGKKCDSVLMGPGLGKNEGSVEAVMAILKELHIPTVLDAEAIEALKKFEQFPLQQRMVITPHPVEFQHLVDREVKVNENDSKSIVLLRSIAMDLHLSVVVKGRIDYVSSEEGQVETNNTGNAGMTVGGSGDVLAGVIASFMAQGLEGFDAARAGVYINGKAGDLLFKQKGYCYSASDLAMTLPYAIR